MDNHSAVTQFMKGVRKDAWVNATRIDGDTFQWDDGTTVATSENGGPWARGEPNNFGKLGEGHVVIRTNGKLNDVNKASKFTVVEACNVRMDRSSTTHS